MKKITLLAALALAGCGETTTEPADSGGSTSERREARQEKREAKMTAGQRNALKSAESYLETGGFSKKGLEEQLSSEAADNYPKRTRSSLSTT